MEEKRQLAERKTEKQSTQEVIDKINAKIVKFKADIDNAKLNQNYVEMLKVTMEDIEEHIMRWTVILKQ